MPMILCASHFFLSFAEIADIYFPELFSRREATQWLLFSQHPYYEPEVYYWIREKKNSSAEVDYVISEGALIVPIEVKAGKSGTLKSLHLFLREKHRSLGIRFNTDIPSVLETHTALPDGLNIPYRLLSLPLYMVGQARRIIRQSTSNAN